MAAVTGTSAETRKTGGISLYGWTALLLILEPILMFAAFFILNGSINWPASLDEPARVNLPLIIEQRGAVILGYGSYLLYSLLILPLAVMLYFALKDREASPLLAVAAAVGVISALTRSLGIVRWLFLMPALAEVYLDPAASEATREAVTVVYTAFNDYAGGIGEILGVGFTGALWVGLTSIALLRSQRFPKWLGLLGILAAILLAPSVLAITGLDVGSLFAFIGGNVLLIWMIALAVVLFRSRRANRQNL